MTDRLLRVRTIISASTSDEVIVMIPPVWFNEKALPKLVAKAIERHAERSREALKQEAGTATYGKLLEIAGRKKDTPSE